MKKVFIWGCYWQGNFGDDLMAILIAKYLVSKGYYVSVFRLHPDLASKYSLKTFNNVYEAVTWADVVVLGGGAFLQAKIPFSHRLLSAPMRSIYKELVKLKSAIIGLNKDLLFCSIGSSGARKFNDLDPVVGAILELPNLKGGTVRLPRDLEICSKVNSFGNIEYIPDILFSTYDMVSIGSYRPRPKKVKVGINISKRDRATLQAILEWHNSNSELVELEFLLTHSKESGISSECYYNSDVITSSVNFDPCDFAEHIADFDVIVSVKLHLGLVAMASGAYFISFNGQPKTVQQLKLLNMEDNIVTGVPEDLIKKLHLVVSTASRAQESSEILKKNIGRSSSHLTALERKLSEC